MDKMRTEKKIPISYWTAWRSGRIAQERDRGTPESNFADLPLFCHMIMEKNDGTVALMSTDNDDRFKYLFLSFGQCIRAFPVLKKV
jgi:hypothetical protein